MYFFALQKQVLAIRVGSVSRTTQPQTTERSGVAAKLKGKGRATLASASAAKTAKTKQPVISFVRMEPVLEIVRTCVFTGRLADEKPVSVILVAEQESAKTEALKYFRGTTTLKYLADLTSKGLAPYRHEIESMKLRHLVIMDLIRVVNHNKGVSNRTIQTLATVMEEGASEESDAGGVTSWGTKFPTLGVITALTPSYFEARAGAWRKSGFLSRFLPVRFEYSQDSVHQIHMAIAKGHKLPQPEAQNLPEHPVKVSMPDAHALTIARKAETLGQQSKLYGFRYHRALRTLAKGNALAHGRFVVGDADVQKILEWSEFFTDRVIQL